MKSKIIYIVFFIFSMQVNIGYNQLPIIEMPIMVSPSFSIYVSPTGNNANSGSISSPVATFQQAMQLISFSSTSDVHGEIVFLAGDYHPTQALIQNSADFQQGSYKKHISIRGEGVVNIYGNLTPANSQLIWLRGSSIKIEKINLFNARGTAIVIGNPNSSNQYVASSKVSDILLKDILIDSTESHGVLSNFVDRVMYDNIQISNGQQENTGVGGNCQWGSALKVRYCKNVSIKNCLVYHNRGEGINVATSSKAIVEGCTSYDNFAPNFYCIRSNNVIFRKNLTFNRDSLYWRNCQSDNQANAQVRKPTAGLSISNEVLYDEMINNSCSAMRSFESGLISQKISVNRYLRFCIS